jgi:hypothetical protein
LRFGLLRSRDMQKRRRSKQAISLSERLSQFAKDAVEKASNLPPGPVREEWMKKVRQAEAALLLVGRTTTETVLSGQTDDDHFPSARTP